MRVTDPVCRMTIDSEKATGSEVWNGKTYYFCSKSCQDKFRGAPDRYGEKPNDPGGHGGHGH